MGVVFLFPSALSSIQRAFATLAVESTCVLRKMLPPSLSENCTCDFARRIKGNQGESIHPLQVIHSYLIISNFSKLHFFGMCNSGTREEVRALLKRLQDDASKDNACKPHYFKSRPHFYHKGLHLKVAFDDRWDSSLGFPGEGPNTALTIVTINIRGSLQKGKWSRIIQINETPSY